MVRGNIYQAPSSKTRSQNNVSPKIIAPADILQGKSGDDNQKRLDDFREIVKSLYEIANSRMDNITQAQRGALERILVYMSTLSRAKGDNSSFHERIEIIDSIFPDVEYPPFTIGSIFSAYRTKLGRHNDCSPEYVYSVARPGKPNCNYAIATVRNMTDITFYPSSVGAEKDRVIVFLYDGSVFNAHIQSVLRRNGYSMVELIKWENGSYVYITKQFSTFDELETLMNPSYTWWIIGGLILLLIIILVIWLLMRKRSQ